MLLKFSMYVVYNYFLETDSTCFCHSRYEFPRYNVFSSITETAPIRVTYFLMKDCATLGGLQDGEKISQLVSMPPS